MVYFISDLIQFFRLGTETYFKSNENYMSAPTQNKPQSHPTDQFLKNNRFSEMKQNMVPGIKQDNIEIISTWKRITNKLIKKDKEEVSNC